MHVCLSSIYSIPGTVVDSRTQPITKVKLLFHNNEVAYLRSLKLSGRAKT